jgi:hypothetical protein
VELIHDFAKPLPQPVRFLKLILELFGVGFARSRRMGPEAFFIF